VYVKTEPQKCHNRIHKRSREGEEHIPLDYLVNCDKYHNDMLDKEKVDCVCHDQIVLDGNIDIYENKKKLEEWIYEIDKFIKN
jgi:deoxyadenosine/deoxycytidine kinase